LEYHNEIQFLFIDFHRRVERRLTARLEAFAEALEVWMTELSEHFTPNWREGWAQFLADREAEGERLHPDSKLAIEEWIDQSARSVGFSATTEQASESTDNDSQRPFVPHPANQRLGYRLPKDSSLTEADVIFAREIAVVTRALKIAIKQKTDEMEQSGFLARMNPFGSDTLTQQSELATLTLQFSQLSLLFVQLEYQHIEWAALGVAPGAGLDVAEAAENRAAPEAGLRSVFVDDAMNLSLAGSIAKAGAKLLLRGAARLGARAGVRIATGPVSAADEATQFLKRLTDEEYNALTADLSRARLVLSPAEVEASVNPMIARMQFGNALERRVATRISEDQELKLLFRHVGRSPNSFDFLGTGRFTGLKFDITTPGQAAKHLARPYGEGLQIIEYMPPKLLP
jgi:hypothetical protein